jgi:pantoate--beta-alanine ligase
MPGDLDKLRDAGVDMVFAPAAAAFTPDDLATTVSVSGVTEVLEGASRPGHFDGVATIVTKLLHVAQPAAAGAKTMSTPASRNLSRSPGMSRG